MGYYVVVHGELIFPPMTEDTEDELLYVAQDLCNVFSDSKHPRNCFDICTPIPYADSEHIGRGSNVIVYFDGETKHHEDDWEYFTKQLCEFVLDGSAIEFVGEDDAHFRLIRKNGAFVYERGTISWESAVSDTDSKTAEDPPMNLTVSMLRKILRNCPDDMPVIIPRSSYEDCNDIYGFYHIRTAGVLECFSEEEPEALCLAAARGGLDISSLIGGPSYHGNELIKCKKVSF